VTKASGVQTQLTSNQTVADVSTNTAVVLNFTGAVSAASLLNKGVELRLASTNTTVPTTLTMSNNGRTATLTPQAPLALNTQYAVYFNDFIAVYDEAGFQVTNSAALSFTTAPFVIDFEDLPDSYSKTTFPTSYRDIVWTNWFHYAPYPNRIHTKRRERDLRSSGRGEIHVQRARVYGRGLLPSSELPW
jgi:hypothetical protein